ncbi:MAG: DUF5343 domain-containing protein [Dehalogenimonas sp.]
MNLPVTKSLPPYVSYRTFWNFLDGLKAAIPARIDRSYWGDKFSGSTGGQLIAALKYLKMIDSSGIPTLRLRQLVFAKGPQRADLLQQLAQEAYPFFLQALDPATATYSQLEEKLREHFPITADVNRKCIKFFIGMSDEAGISLSTFITRKSKNTRGSAARKMRKITPSDHDNVHHVSPDATPPIGNNVQETPVGDANQLLLAKFPTFDPNWTDEVKLRWFETFDKLQRIITDNRK